MEIVKFNSEDVEQEFHIDGATIVAEFRTYQGERIQIAGISKKPRKIYTDKKGNFIKIYLGYFGGNKTKKHYIS